MIFYLIFFFLPNSREINVSFEKFQSDDDGREDSYDDDGNGNRYSDDDDSQDHNDGHYHHGCEHDSNNDDKQ
jgi:hypothetical protein